MKDVDDENSLYDLHNRASPMLPAQVEMCSQNIRRTLIDADLKEDGFGQWLGSAHPATSVEGMYTPYASASRTHSDMDGIDKWLGTGYSSNVSDDLDAV
jgi:hypothetical protein